MFSPHPAASITDEEYSGDLSLSLKRFLILHFADNH